MPASSVIRQLQAAIATGAATGINNTLKLVLSDLERNTPERTGLLSRSYLITQRANAALLKGMIGNSIPYAAYQYPFRVPLTVYKTAPKLLRSPGPSLFSSKPGAQPEKGVLKGNQVDTSKVEILLKTETEHALHAALS